MSEREWPEIWLAYRGPATIADLEDPGMQVLARRLLELDGVNVVLHRTEPDLDAILLGGQEWGPPKFRLKHPEFTSNACHTNVKVAKSAEPGRWSIATGYAMADDKRWRQHSWLIDTDGEPVDTTYEPLKYYGAVVVPGPGAIPK